jgi:MerR family transcriptional regulator, light-induced transcriptional regulator
MTATHPVGVMDRAPACEQDRVISDSPLHIAVGAGPLIVARLERAVRRFRLQMAHNLLDEALTSMPPAVVVRDVVLPLIDRLEEAGDEAAVRFASSALEARLLALARGWDSIAGPLAILACGPREHRVLELIGLGLGLAEARWRIAYLGAATPVSAIRETVRLDPPAAVVVSVGTPDLPPRDTLALRLLARESPLLLSGSAGPAVGHQLRCGSLPRDPCAAAAMLAAGSTARGDARSSDWEET